jgi:glycosyltransferase involved in cell wall biosynthesis
LSSKGVTSEAGGLRVLFLADAVFEDKPGGSRVVARELARRLVDRGHDVTFLVGRHDQEAPPDERRDGIRIVRYACAGQGLAYIKEGRDACRKLMNEQPWDIVHTHFAYSAYGPLQALPHFGADARQVARVRTFHGPWDAEGWREDTARPLGWIGRAKALARRRLRYAVERHNLNGSERIFVLSEFFERYVRASYGLRSPQLCRVSGGVDFARFRPALDRGSALRALGMPTHGPLLLSVRRLAPRMGLDRLIDAMPAVVKRFRQARLVIGGDGPEKQFLQEKIAQLKLGSHVRLIGFIPDADLAKWYQAADLFVLPTVALEGFGLVTAEALACGTPVVGTPVGATPEILGPLDQRLLADDATPRALSKAITAFFGESWAAELTPTRLSRYVRGRFDWDLHADATETAYWEILGGRKQPGTVSPPRHIKELTT